MVGGDGVLGGNSLVGGDGVLLQDPNSDISDRDTGVITLNGDVAGFPESIIRIVDPLAASYVRLPLIGPKLIFNDFHFVEPVFDMRSVDEDLPRIPLARRFHHVF